VRENETYWSWIGNVFNAVSLWSWVIWQAKPRIKAIHQSYFNVRRIRLRFTVGDSENTEDEKPFDFINFRD